MEQRKKRKKITYRRYIYLYIDIRVIGKLVPGQGKYKQSKMPFIQVIIIIIIITIHNKMINYKINNNNNNDNDINKKGNSLT